MKPTAPLETGLTDRAGGSVFTGARAHFCAAHIDDRGRLHGHTWRVRAVWPFAGENAMDRQASLIAALADFDHAKLPDGLRLAETLAALIGARLGAVRVDVWRDAENLGATWRA